MKTLRPSICGLMFFFAAIFSLTQCHKDEITSKPEENSKIKDDFDVSAKEAIEVAQQFTLTNGKGNLDPNARIGAVMEVTGQQTALDSADLKPLLHVINLKKGYAIVSADLRAMPVIAFSEDGKFDLNDVPNGVNLWLQSAKEKLKEIKRKNFKSNDIVNKEWRKYLSSKNGRIEDTNCIEWYQYGQFQCQGRFTTFGPLLNTGWTQSGVSSSMLMPGFKNCDGCGRYLAGCGPVAIAQIDEFYHPNPDRPRATSNGNCGSMLPGEQSLGNLMKWAGYHSSANYDYLGTCNTMTWPSNIPNGFTGLGYSNGGTSYAANNYEKIKIDLTGNHPVVFSGSTCLTCFNDYHIWVCDGLRENNYSEFNCATKTCNEWSFSYLHMNWGWNRLNDWYAFGSYHPDGANYDANMHVITGIRP